MNRRDFLASLSLSATVMAVRPSFGAEAPQPTWDLSELYPNAASWDANAAALEHRIAALGQRAGTFAQSPQQFAATLNAISQTRRDVMRLSTYARLASSADLRDASAGDRLVKANALAGELAVATAWLDPAVRSLGPAGINAFLAADPTLDRFQHSLADVIRLTPHALPANEAAALASGGAVFDGPQSIYNQLLGSDMPHPTIVLSTGASIRLNDAGYTQVRDVAERADRKQAFDTFWRSYGAYENTLGAIYSTQIAGDNLQARLARYDSALDAALDANATPHAVFTNLITEARAGIPLLQRYLRLRQRALGLPDLHYYDIYAPLGRTTRQFSSAAARELMLESVRQLGPGYCSRLAAASSSRWVDFPDRPGKYAGSFTNPDAYDVHPYILLNYTPNYHGLTTYVHEWGHAMHSVLANAKQPFETSHYETFVAEIASTLNEQLLAQHLIDAAADKQEKLYYLGQLLELLRLNIFREPMLTEFEHAVHLRAAAGAALSGAAMSEVYFKLLQDYHAPAMVIDPAYAMEWSFIPQFYTAYYSFQYATSIVASSYFAQAILAGDTQMRDRYFAMLKAGGSDYPYQLVRNAGVDLATPEPYRALMRRFEGLLDQLEAALG